MSSCCSVDVLLSYRKSWTLSVRILPMIFSQRVTMEMRDKLPRRERNGGKPGTKQVSCDATRGESEREKKKCSKNKSPFNLTIILLTLLTSWFSPLSLSLSLPSHYQNLLAPTTWLLWEYSHIFLRDKWRFELTCLHKSRVIPILKIVQVTENRRRRGEGNKIIIEKSWIWVQLWNDYNQNQDSITCHSTRSSHREIEWEKKLEKKVKPTTRVRAISILINFRPSSSHWLPQWSPSDDHRQLTTH